MAKSVEADADASAKKPKRDGPPKYTGRKGAMTRRFIGSESPYKLISRAFRKALEAQVRRGPTQREMQEAKASFNLGNEQGRAAWAYRRALMLGEELPFRHISAAPTAAPGAAASA